MNSNHKIANLILLATIFIPTLLFVLLHSTPKSAIRTKVFFDGHPKIALTSPLKSDKDQYQAYYQFIKVRKGHEITHSGISHFFSYHVKKKGFLYFAKNYTPGV